MICGYGIIVPRSGLLTQCLYSPHRNVQRHVLAGFNSMLRHRQLIVTYSKAGPVARKMRLFSNLLG